jgi:hypothetical protein
MQIRPLRVRRIDAVIDDRCPIASPLGVGRYGKVGTDYLNALGEVGSSASDCGTHSLTSRHEMTDYGETERTCPEDDVQLLPVRALRCQCPHLPG